MKRRCALSRIHMAVGQNQWCHFGVGAPPILAYFSGNWDVHWGYKILTHGHIVLARPVFQIFLGFDHAALEMASTPLGGGPWLCSKGSQLAFCMGPQFPFQKQRVFLARSP